MKIKLLWALIVFQLLSLLLILAFCNYIYLIPSPAGIYITSFILGACALLLLRKRLLETGFPTKIMLVILFLLSIGLIPMLGKEVGDKANAISKTYIK